MVRGGGPTPNPKRLRRTIESPGTDRTARSSLNDTSNGSEVWHSTAIRNNSMDFSTDSSDLLRGADLGSEIEGSQPFSQKGFVRPTGVPMRSSQQVLSQRAATRNPVATTISPVVITESTGHFAFSGVLQKHGYFLSPEGNHAMNEPRVFRKSVTDWIDGCTDRCSQLNEEVKQFISDMKRYLSYRENLKNALTATEQQATGYQPSLLHYLLGVLPLQRHIFAVIFPALAECAYTARNDEDVFFFRDLLSQIKWLPYLNEGERFTDDLLEFLERATPRCQEEMIQLLPDVIPSAHHVKVGEKLQKMLEDFSPLCSLIMACFSAIDVPSADLEKVRDTALENMLIAEAKEVPVYMGFLLGANDPKVLDKVISDIREKMVFKPPLSVDDELKTSMKTLIEKIKFNASINHNLAHQWVKQIRDEYVTEPAEFKPLDLLMLLIFTASDKMADAPLRALFSNESLSLQTFNDLVESMPTVMDHIYEYVKAYCEKFLWGNSMKHFKVATKVLTVVFDAVSDTYARDIVKLFTCTLAHSSHVCRDSLIDSMQTMAMKDRKRFLGFTNLVMAIMDYVIKFSPEHIRSIIRILAAVAYIPNNRDSQRFETEFFILLKKQISQRDEKIRAIGVIAAVAAIDQLIRQEDVEGKLKELVDLVWATVENDNNSCWIFFDEMATVATEQNLNPETFETLRETLGAKFKENWLIEESSIESRMLGEHKLRLKQMMNANETLEIEPLVMKFENHPMGLSPQTLPAHTRLLCALEYKVGDGTLQEVDIIIGCPFLLPDFDDYCREEKIQELSVNKKNTLANYLLCAINYVRELVSAFCKQKDTASRFKVFIRMNHLVELQKRFTTLVSCWKNQFPALPFAYALEKNPSAVNFAAASKVRKKKGSEKKTKPAISASIIEDTAVDKDKDQLSDTASPPAFSIHVAATKKNENYQNTAVDPLDKFQPLAIRPFVRRFSPCVFKMLKSRFVMHPPNLDYLQLLEEAMQTDSPAHREVTKPVSILTPEMLILLLQDLNQQAQNDKWRLCLVNDVASRFSRDFLKCLCSHLDVLVTSCEVEYSSWSLSKKMEADACFRLLYVTIKNYLEALTKPEHKDKFSSAIGVLVEHAGSSSSGSDGKKAVAYIAGNPDFINNPLTALEQVHIMKTIYENVENIDREGMSEQIGEVISTFLKREWKVRSAEVLLFLKIWFATSTDPLSDMLVLSKDLILGDISTAIPNPNTEYKSCTSPNFHTWYRGIIETLCVYTVKHLKKKILNIDEAYKRWSAAIEVFQTLVDVIQKKRQALIITPLLKNCRFFLEVFTNHGVNLLPTLWNTDPTEARAFIRKLQGPTRKIQYICEHCKVQKTTGLIRYVPRVKRSLEALVFRVREVLTLHGAPNAFWMGSLKHKNLDGEEIDSQISDVVDEDLEDDDSEDDDASVVNEDLFDMPQNIDDDSN